MLRGLYIQYDLGIGTGPSRRFIVGPYHHAGIAYYLKDIEGFEGIKNACIVTGDKDLDPKEW